jgi:hypothetical protein
MLKIAENKYEVKVLPWFFSIFSEKLVLQGGEDVRGIATNMFNNNQSDWVMKKALL